MCRSSGWDSCNLVPQEKVSGYVYWISTLQPQHHHNSNMHMHRATQHCTCKLWPTRYNTLKPLVTDDQTISIRTRSKDRNRLNNPLSTSLAQNATYWIHKVPYNSCLYYILIDMSKQCPRQLYLDILYYRMKLPPEILWEILVDLKAKFCIQIGISS